MCRVGETRRTDRRRQTADRQRWADRLRAHQVTFRPSVISPLLALIALSSLAASFPPVDNRYPHHQHHHINTSSPLQPLCRETHSHPPPLLLLSAYLCRNCPRRRLSAVHNRHHRSHRFPPNLVQTLVPSPPSSASANVFFAQIGDTPAPKS
jgi:hypothetical protein